MKKDKICFIVCYFGKLPVWFPAFLLSCNTNPSIDWLIFTDASNKPTKKTDNVFFERLSLTQFKEKAHFIMKTDIRFSKPYKLCDFKPIYGDIFKEELSKYHYWGHCDIDVIWGDISGFLKEIQFKNYDIISSRKSAISGHFTLYRNTENLRKLYSKVKNYKKVFVEDKYSGFDEGFFSYHLYQEYLKVNFGCSIFWPDNYAVDRYELDHYPYYWRWQNGKIISRKGNERVYLHFMKWKYTMKYIDFDYEDNPSQFLITKYGLWSKKMNITNKLTYLFPNHLPRLIKSYINKFKGIIKHNILKKERPPYIPVPKGYEEIY